MMRKDWLDSSREGMDGFEEAAPDGLWDEIVSSVPAKGRKHGTVVTLPWLWRSVGAAAAAVAVVVLLFVDRPKDSSDKPTASVVETTETSPTNPSSSVHTGEASLAEAATNADGLSRAGKSMLAALTETCTEVSRREVSDEAPVVFPAGDENGEADVSVSSPDVSDPIPENAEDQEMYVPESVTIRDGEDWSGRSSFDEPSGRRKGLSAMDILVSGAMTESRSQNVFDSRMFYRGAAPSNPGSAEDEGDEAEGTVSNGPMRRVPLSKLPDVNTTTRHYRPVRVAATASWRMTDRLSVESGLAWTKLSSNFTTASGVATSEDKQSLQYLGIPLNLTCNLADAGLFSFYLSGGGMMEKCIAGTKISSEYVSGALMSSTESKISIDPLLWSVNASAGAQANILKNFGIYFEPGVSYHFNDGSSVQTIYKEHPLDFVMTFGLRVSFK
ncbi:MAG: hypothetical protein MJY84_05610 [Bacteroidales bacterium]|nr:hypothetical protein [Bacteroidales bacterium]